MTNVVKIFPAYGKIINRSNDKSLHNTHSSTGNTNNAITRRIKSINNVFKYNVDNSINTKTDLTIKLKVKIVNT